MALSILMRVCACTRSRLRQSSNGSFHFSCSQPYFLTKQTRKRSRGWKGPKSNKQAKLVIYYFYNCLRLTRTLPNGNMHLRDRTFLKKNFFEREKKKLLPFHFSGIINLTWQIILLCHPLQFLRLAVLLQKEVRARAPLCVCVCVWSHAFSLPKDKAVIYVTSKPFHIVYVVPYRSTMSRLD